MKNLYGDFAQYYDILGWNSFAKSSAERLKAFFKLRGIKPSTILDLACGTGELEKSLSKSRIDFTGVDISSSMLKVARGKCPQSKFVSGDAAKVRLNKQFDMALLLFDSANHMNSLSHLIQVFRNARRHLKPGGFFIFDFVTPSGMEEWEEINIKRTDKFTLFYYGYYYQDKMISDIFIEAFIKEGKKYRRVFQKIVERSYPPSDIINGLRKSGFKKIMVSSYDTREEIETASRLWFVCS